MIKKLHLSLSLAFIGLLGLINFTYAQETTSSMSGIVKDKNGTLPGVTISAIHLPTGSKYVTSTRSDGRFNLSGLKVGGPYTISASYIGYSGTPQDNINLILGENYEANFNLTETSVQLKGIVVKANQNKTFNSNRTGASEIISRSQIERLPTISRSLSDFTKLSPYGSGGQTNSFAGRNNLYNNITVNGASFNNTFGLSGTIGGQARANPISIDAVDQIQVNISPYDVTQGSFSGAGVNTLTKSGSNDVYGTVYGYYQSPNLVGTKYGDNAPLAKQQFNYNLEGFSFGFPIVKNKLFLFINAERERRSSPFFTYVASRPGLTGGAGNVSVPTASSLDSLSAFLKSKYNYDPGVYENFNRRFYRNNVTARFDLNINPRNSLNLNLFYLRSYADQPASGRSASLTTLPFSGAGYTINNDLYSGIIELNSRFSNSISNKLQLGYTQMRDYRSALTSSLFPEVDIRSGTSSSALYTSFGYEPFTANNILNTDIIQINDYFKIFSGIHEFTVGTQNQIQWYKNGFSPQYNSYYSFNSLNDFYAAANTGVDNAYQYQSSFSALTSEFPFAKPKDFQLGFLAQDKITLDPKFILTLGFRADIPIISGQFSDNPNVPGLAFRDGKHYSTSQIPNTKVLLSPRIGFNWDVNGDRSFQVRGGTGIFTGPPPIVWISNQASNNGVLFGSFFANQALTKGKPIGYPFSPDVNKYRPAPGPTNLPTSYNLALTGNSFNFPQVWRTSLGFDAKLFGGIVATVEGIYTQDINAIAYDNVDVPRGNPLQGVDTRVRYPSSQIFTGNSVANPNISNAILLRNSQKGYSYNASVKLERNVKNLFTALIYTIGDSYSLVDAGSTASGSWSGRAVSGDVNADQLGYSSYRVPNRFLAIASYRFEYLKLFATSIGLTYEVQPGGNFSYTYNGDLNNDGVTNNDLWYVPSQQSDINLIDVKSGTTVTYSAAQQWYDLNNYINQDTYLSSRRGQYAERNAVIIPYYGQVNLNFSQDIFINLKNGKRNTLRFSADILNFQNLVNKHWGIQQSAVGPGNIIAFKGINAAGQPNFSLNYLNRTTSTPYTSSFVQNSSSIWTAQLGLRYIFQ